MGKITVIHPKIVSFDIRDYEPVSGAKAVHVQYDDGTKQLLCYFMYNEGFDTDEVNNLIAEQCMAMCGHDKNNARHMWNEQFKDNLHTVFFL